jgi:hypothetical protein
MDSPVEEERFEQPVPLGKGSAGNVPTRLRPEGWKKVFGEAPRLTGTGGSNLSLLNR